MPGLPYHNRPEPGSSSRGEKSGSDSRVHNIIPERNKRSAVSDSEPRKPGHAGRRITRFLATLAGIGGVLYAVFGTVVPPSQGARAIQLCSREANALMRKAGISERKIKTLCALAARSRAPLIMSVKRFEWELGYCRVTLALNNNSSAYLNNLSLSSAGGRFEIFRFSNILPGTTGYASAKSRLLLTCNELKAEGITFHWPASLRLDDRAVRGRRLKRFRPVLRGKTLSWNK